MSGLMTLLSTSLTLGIASLTTYWLLHPEMQPRWYRPINIIGVVVTVICLTLMTFATLSFGPLSGAAGIVLFLILFQAAWQEIDRNTKKGVIDIIFAVASLYSGFWIMLELMHVGQFWLFAISGLVALFGSAMGAFYMFDHYEGRIKKPTAY